MDIAPTRLLSHHEDLTMLQGLLDYVTASCEEVSRVSIHSPNIKNEVKNIDITQ